ncbi:MAG TPA: transposase, partial [Bryobacteraceae bacterium]
QSLKMYDSIQERIGAYETEIERRLAKMQRAECQDQPPPLLKNKNKAKMIRQRGEEPMRAAWFRMSGVDLTAIDAIGVGVVQVLLSEYGPDLSCFPTEKQFVSHVALAPKKPMSGGKPVKKKKQGSASSRVSQVFRNAAMSLRNSKTALGAYFRHIAQRLGLDIAAFATARKLATLSYCLLRWGHAYVDEGAEAYEKRYQTARVNRLFTAASQLGLQLVPKPW